MGTVTFRSCVSPSRALQAYTCQCIPKLPLPDAFGKWSTHAERVQRDWMGEEGEEEELSKMGERSGAGQGGEEQGLAQR